MSLPDPYRAIICGEECIIHGWRGRTLLTDQGNLKIWPLYTKWQIQNERLYEIALIQSDGKGGWLINGKPLSFLESLPMGARLSRIAKDEDLRVYGWGIRAVAWIETNGKAANVTELLDELKRFWKTAALPIPEPGKNTSLSNALWELSQNLHEHQRFQELFKTWSNPMWLTEISVAGQKEIVSAEQKKLAAANAELEKTQAQLRKSQAAASDTMQEALSKWMKFEPRGMGANTKGRVEKAVKMYLTDKERYGSLAKIAAVFNVSRKTVSLWFKTFTEETGYPVVTHVRHESVKVHLQADLEQEEEDETED